MKQLEMKHTALILSSCSWSCCTFRKFIIRWLYPQCFPCSTLYNQQFIFLSLKKKTQQQQNPQLQRKKRGRKYKQEWLKICLIASCPCKKKKKIRCCHFCAYQQTSADPLPFSITEVFLCAVSPSSSQYLFFQLFFFFSLACHAPAFL